MAPSLERIKGRKARKPFFAIPRELLQSDVWASLRPRAVKLLCDLGEQYRGNNNGDLDMVWEKMNKKGWTSKDQLNKARIELLDKGLIEKTRQGGRNIASLYALTIHPIDDCINKKTGWSKFDPNVIPTRVASNKWKNIFPVPRGGCMLARVAGQQ